MSQIDSGGPAFPSAYPAPNPTLGMSLRAYYAGQFVAAFIVNGTRHEHATRQEQLDCPRFKATIRGAINYADALIAALEE